MTQIHIKNLRLRTIIGIFPWEQKNKQDVIINATIHFDGDKAGRSDRIEDTLDYKALTKSMIRHVEQHRFALIEALVEQLLDIIMAYGQVTHARIEIDKPGALRFADSVSVSISRERHQINQENK